jgi:BirA family biotin operon repressor/biotin-[acetyl-CoA-carboxylase] ligase
VLGIGLNLAIAEDEFPPELRDRATSLWPDPRGVRNFGMHEVSNTASEALSDRLEVWLDADADAVLEEWRGRDALLGREVSWDRGSGVADGVDERGHLLVRLADGDRAALGAGDVHLTSF